MFIIALLLVALVCLAVGLLLASTTWLAVSLLASLSAGLLLYLSRARILASRNAHAGRPVAETKPGEGAAEPEVWVVDGRPRYHREDCEILHGQDAEAIPLRQATEDGFIACSLCEPDAARTA